MNAEQDPKRLKVADFFPKLLQSKVSQDPGILRQFHPTGMLHRPARPKRFNTCLLAAENTQK